MSTSNSSSDESSDENEYIDVVAVDDIDDLVFPDLETIFGINNMKIKLMIRTWVQDMAQGWSGRNIDPTSSRYINAPYVSGRNLSANDLSKVIRDVVAIVEELVYEAGSVANLLAAFSSLASPFVLVTLPRRNLSLELQEMVKWASNAASNAVFKFPPWDDKKDLLPIVVQWRQNTLMRYRGHSLSMSELSELMRSASVMYLRDMLKATNLTFNAECVLFTLEQKGSKIKMTLGDIYHWGEDSFLQFPDLDRSVDGDPHGIINSIEKWRQAVFIDSRGSYIDPFCLQRLIRGALLLVNNLVRLVGSIELLSEYLGPNFVLLIISQRNRRITLNLQEIAQWGTDSSLLTKSLRRFPNNIIRDIERKIIQDIDDWREDVLMSYRNHHISIRELYNIVKSACILFTTLVSRTGNVETLFNKYLTENAYLLTIQQENRNFIIDMEDLMRLDYNQAENDDERFDRVNLLLRKIIYGSKLLDMTIMFPHITEMVIKKKLSILNNSNRSAELIAMTQLGMVMPIEGLIDTIDTDPYDIIDIMRSVVCDNYKWLQERNSLTDHHGTAVEDVIELVLRMIWLVKYMISRTNSVDNWKNSNDPEKLIRYLGSEFILFKIFQYTSAGGFNIRRKGVEWSLTLSELLQVIYDEIGIQREDDDDDDDDDYIEVVLGDDLLNRVRLLVNGKFSSRSEPRPSLSGPWPSTSKKDLISQNLNKIDDRYGIIPMLRDFIQNTITKYKRKFLSKDELYDLIEKAIDLVNEMSLKMDGINNLLQVLTPQYVIIQLTPDNMVSARRVTLEEIIGLIRAQSTPQWKDPIDKLVEEMYQPQQDKILKRPIRVADKAEPERKRVSQSKKLLGCFSILSSLLEYLF